MSATFMPRTRLGKCSVILLVVAIVLVIIVAAIGSNMEPPSSNTGFFGNLPLAITALGAFAAAAISLMAGFISVYRDNERSVLVYACIIIDVLFVYFGIAQVVGEVTNTPG